VRVPWPLRSYAGSVSGHTRAMTTYTEDQLRDLLELWGRNSQGLSEAQMSALVEWNETPEATKAKIRKMVEARQTGVRPQRLTGAEESYLQERGLGAKAERAAEPKPSKPSLLGRLLGKRPGG
jgi:hypothetical protein